jgi:hypothetical protein
MILELHNRRADNILIYISYIDVNIALLRVILYI